jgi:protein subunit release factor B
MSLFGGKKLMIDRRPLDPTKRPEQAAPQSETVSFSERLYVNMEQPATGQPGTHRLPRNYPIPESAYTVISSRGSGPGGQGANSSSNKATVHIDLVKLAEQCPELDDDIFEALKRHAGARVTGQDILILSSHEQRSLRQNVNSCVRVLQDMLHAASYVPVPQEKFEPAVVMTEKRMISQRKKRNKRALTRETKAMGGKKY